MPDIEAFEPITIERKPSTTFYKGGTYRSDRTYTDAAGACWTYVGIRDGDPLWSRENETTAWILNAVVDQFGPLAVAGDAAPDRTSEIQAALDAVPAPPWRWIGSRTSGGPQLVTDHSGRQYLLRAAKPVDARGDELLDPVTDYPIYGDLKFRDQRPGERYSTMRRGDELAVGRTSYDEDNIVDVDNPIARFMRDAPQYVADLLAENARLRGEVDTLAAENKVLERALGLNEEAAA